MSDFFSDVTITEKQINSPYFGVLYSAPGCGKSWLCRFADKPFYLATEKGCEKVPNIGRFLINEGTENERVKMPASSDEFFDILRHFVTTEHEYKTIVVDSGKFVDILFAADVIKKNPYETIKKQQVKVESLGDYAFGKGYEKLKAYWNKFFVAVDALEKKGISVILIAHSSPKTTPTLDGDDFKKQCIDLTSFGAISVPNLVYARADWCYFMRSEIKTRKVTSNFGASKTIAMNGSEPEIIVYTRSQSGFDAKVRTSKVDNVPDYYLIDIHDDETSKVIFSDLKK